VTIPLSVQIAEVERELALRANVYPGLVSRKKMRQAEAEKHTENMMAVLKTLRWLQGNDVPAELPRPGDLLAAMIHIRTLGADADGASDAVMAEAIVEIRKVIADVLTGIPLPKVEGAKEPQS
jgi:hypothetical protein